MSVGNLQENINTFYKEVILNENGIYPHLSKLMNKHNQNRYRYLSNLFLYVNDFGATEGQEWSYDRFRGWEVYASRDKLVELYGGSKTTWQSYLYEFITLGLICISVPRMTEAGTKYNTPQKQYSADRARAQGRNPTWYYSIPLYTPELLAKAEERAGGVSRVGSGLDKDSARYIIGDETETKKTFDIGYGMHDETKTRRDLISGHVMLKVLNRGYTTKEEILRFCTIAGKEYGNAYRWKTTLDSYLPELLDELGLVYARPTERERKRFDLSSAKYIITKRYDVRALLDDTEPQTGKVK